MKCKACQIRLKDWNGSDPKCAFESSNTFNEENWNCATVAQIREICFYVSVAGNKNFPGVDFQLCGDQKYITVNLHQIQESISFIDGDVPIALWVSWYKNRGKTEAMWLLYEDKPPRKPTEDECSAIAKACAHALKLI